MTQKFRWPQTMPDKGRVKDAATIAQIGAAATFAPTSFSCARTIHISLFFDGTNNNDDEKNTEWRDSKTLSHTNVARLYTACKLEPENGRSCFCIPGAAATRPRIRARRVWVMITSSVRSPCMAGRSSR